MNVIIRVLLLSATAPRASTWSRNPPAATHSRKAIHQPNPRGTRTAGRLSRCSAIGTTIARTIHSLTPRTHHSGNGTRIAASGQPGLNSRWVRVVGSWAGASTS
jgi:hypothetical protein